MKIKGYKPSNPNIETVVLPRGDGHDLVFRCQAVLDYSEFETLVSIPTPPTIIKANGTKMFDMEDKKFLSSLTKYNTLKTAWIVIKSLEATEGLEWEKVKIGDPDTWELWMKELQESFITNTEINAILEGVSSANGLDENKLEQARKSFLAGQVQEQ